MRQTLSQMDPLMTVKTAAEYLSIGERTLRRWIGEEFIPPAIVFRIGRGAGNQHKTGGAPKWNMVRIRKSALDNWIETQAKEGGE